MKNFSSLSLGNNDNLRNIYERSLSQSSVRSCETPRDKIGNEIGKENSLQFANHDKSNVF